MPDTGWPATVASEAVVTALTVYVASSFKHLHAVRLLNRALRDMGCRVLDWSEKATPPEGLNAAQRREWMDTDHGGEVYAFCAHACRESDVLIYLGTSGQDAGVEVGMASGCGCPVLGIRGPLESPGLMLHGAVSVWVDSVEVALEYMEGLVQAVRENPDVCRPEALKKLLCRSAKRTSAKCNAAKCNTEAGKPENCESA